jgi:putative endonuclease
MERQSDRGQSRQQRGAAAEALAAEYLSARGLEVLVRNLRCRGGEIDLVCRDGGVLVVVEVRQRSRHDFGGALASVTWRKQRKIIRAARFLLESAPRWRNALLRFDVVGVHTPPQGEPCIEWVRDAFRAA